MIDSTGSVTGGVVYNDGSLLLENVLIVQNQVLGAPVWGSVMLAEEPVELWNCTVSENHTVDSAPASTALYSVGSNFNLHNSDISFNTATGTSFAIQGATTGGFNNVYGHDLNGFPPLSVDPTYIGVDDYRLDTLSPLVDMGDPAILDVDGTRSDIGCYGGPGGNW